MRSKFLVVIYPAAPDNTGIANASSYTIAKPPTVKWITASSPQEAASEVKVDPGGHALVVPEADVCRFDRPKQAALIERQANGSPLRQGVAA